MATGTWRYEPIWVRRERERQQLEQARRAALPYVRAGTLADMAIARQAFNQTLNRDRIDAFARERNARIAKDTMAKLAGTTTKEAYTSRPYDPEKNPPTPEKKKDGGGFFGALGDIASTVAEPFKAIGETAKDVVTQPDEILGDVAHVGGSLLRVLDVPARYAVRPAIKATTGLDVQGYIDDPNSNPFLRTLLAAGTDPLTYLAPGALAKGFTAIGAAERAPSALKAVGSAVAPWLEQPGKMAITGSLGAAVGAQAGHEIGGPIGETVGALTGGLVGGFSPALASRVQNVLRGRYATQTAQAVGRTLIADDGAQRALWHALELDAGVSSTPLTKIEEQALSRIPAEGRQGSFAEAIPQRSPITGTLIEWKTGAELEGAYGEYVKTHFLHHGSEPRIYINEELWAKPDIAARELLLRERTITHEEAHALWDTFLTPYERTELAQRYNNPLLPAAAGVRRDVAARWGKYVTRPESAVNEAFAEAWASKQSGLETPYSRLFGDKIDAIVGRMPDEMKTAVHRQRRIQAEWSTHAMSILDKVEADAPKGGEWLVSEAPGGTPGWYDVHQADGTLGAYINQTGRLERLGYDAYLLNGTATKRHFATLEEAKAWARAEASKTDRNLLPFGKGAHPEGGQERVVMPKSVVPDYHLGPEEVYTADPNHPVTFRRVLRADGSYTNQNVIKQDNGKWFSSTGEVATAEKALAENLRTGAYDPEGTKVLPRARERFWFHGTSDLHYDTPDPKFGVEGVTQGPGVYLTADPEVAAGYGGWHNNGRSFAVEFDGNVADLVNPIGPHDPMFEGGPSWDDVRVALARRLREKLEKPMPLAHKDAIERSLLYLDDGPNLWSDRRFGRASASGRAKEAVYGPEGRNGYAYREVLKEALDEGFFEGGRQGRRAGYYETPRFGHGGRAGPLNLIHDVMGDMGIDAVFHHSPGADGEVLIVINGEKARVRADLRSGTAHPGDTLEDMKRRSGERTRTAETPGTQLLDVGDGQFRYYANANTAYRDYIIQKAADGRWGVFNPDGSPAMSTGFGSPELARDYLDDVNGIKADLPAPDNRFYQRGYEFNQNGDLTGAPPGIRTQRDVERLTANAIEAAKTGERGRYWYDKTGAYLLHVAGGDREMADRFAQVLGILSQRKSVASQTPLAVRAWAQWLTGTPLSQLGGDVHQLQKVAGVLEGTAEWEGRKTSNFYRAMLRNIDPEKYAREFKNAEPVVDIWMMRHFGYTVTKPTKAQYDFVAKRITEAADQLGWLPDQVQAAIWVEEKARAKLAGKRAADPLGKDFSETLRKNMAQVSWETMPGASSGLMPWLKDAPPEVQAEWHVAASKALMDDDGTDAIAKFLKLQTPGMFDAPGVWLGDISPGAQTKVIVAQKPGVEVPGRKSPYYPRLVDESSAQVLDAYAAAKAYFLKQDAVAWSAVFDGANTAERDTTVLNIGRALTAEEARALDAALADHLPPPDPTEPLHAIIATENGAWIKNIGDADNEAFAKATRAAIADSLEGKVKVSSGKGDGRLYFNDWKEAPDGRDYRDLFERSSGRSLSELEAALSPRIEAARADFESRYGPAESPDRAANRGYDPLGEQKPDFVAMAPSEIARVLGITDQKLVKQLRELDSGYKAKTLTREQTKLRDQLGKRLREEYGLANGGRKPVWMLPPGTRSVWAEKNAQRLENMRKAGFSDDDIKAALPDYANPEASHYASDYLGQARWARMLQLEQVASNVHAQPAIRQQARARLAEEFGINPETPLDIAAAEAQIGDVQDRMFQRAEVSTAQARSLPDHQVPPEKKSAVTAKRVALEALNLPRASVAAFDASGMARQSAVLGVAFPKEWKDSIATQLNAWKSAEWAEQNMKLRNADADWQLLKAHGAYEAPWGARVTELGDREEAFMSSIVGRVPGFRASERAYAEGLNDIRYGAGKKILGNLREEFGNDIPAERLDGVAKYLNVTTGRGDIGALKGPAFNALFFSPRFFASRLQVPWMAIAHSDPYVRALARKSMTRFVVSGLTMLGLAAAAGKATGAFSVGVDPTSSDFGKIKWGKTSYDFWAGYQSLVRYTINFGLGQGKEGEDRLDILGRFARGKLAPVPSTVVSLLKGEQPGSNREEFDPSVGSIGDILYRNTVPLFFQQTWDAIKEDGPMGAIKTVPEFVGVGTSTYSAPTEQLDGFAVELARNDKTKYPDGVGGFYDLQPGDRQKVKDAHPEAWQAYVAGNTGKLGRSEQLRAQLEAKQQKADDALLAGDLSIDDWKAQYESNRDELRFRRKEIYGDSDMSESDIKTPTDAYFWQLNQVDKGLSTMDDVDAWLDTLSPADQKSIEENTGLGGTKLARAYRAMQRDYYNIPKYRGFTANQGFAIDELLTNARSIARDSEPASVISAITRLGRGLDPRVVSGARRAVLFGLPKNPLRERFEKTNPVTVLLGRGLLTPQELGKLKAAAA